MARLAPRLLIASAVAAAACSDPSTAPTASPDRSLSPGAASLQGAPNPDIIPDRHIFAPDPSVYDVLMLKYGEPPSRRRKKPMSDPSCVPAPVAPAAGPPG